MEYAFFPSADEPNAIGLLFSETRGNRRTTVVDPEYLLTLLAGEEAGVDLGGLVIRAERTLGSCRGWPDEWPAGRDDYLYAAVELLRLGMSWEELRAVNQEFSR